MNFILFDDYCHFDLLPLTYTRAVADLRVGILTLREKWERCLPQKTSMGILTADYLHAKYEMPAPGDNCYINAALLPTQALATSIGSMPRQSALVAGDTIVAFRLNGPIPDFAQLSRHAAPLQVITQWQQINIQQLDINDMPIQRLRHWWDIFTLNETAINSDFVLLTQGRTSQPLSGSNILIGSANNLFVEAGASIEAAILNTNAGPVYIGRDAEIMEGASVRGPFALCEHAALKMGAKIYGATTIGPYSKVGGEVSNSVILGYSNKAHDGFMGNSVIGEWCNWGADSNNSNLKNNYGTVQVWSCHEQRYINTGRQFCGMVMGDHAKCGINTMFNTGTVAGVCANIFGGGFPPKYIPSFAWGGGTEWAVYELEKAMQTAERVYARRQIAWTEADSRIFAYIFGLR